MNCGTSGTSGTGETSGRIVNFELGISCKLAPAGETFQVGKKRVEKS